MMLGEEACGCYERSDAAGGTPAGGGTYQSHLRLIHSVLATTSLPARRTKVVKRVGKKKMKNYKS